MKLPSGTVTFLFTDIEGSTRLLEHLGDRYAKMLAAYREILRASAAKFSGQEVDTTGDASFFAFPRVTDAVAAAVDAQHALDMHPWPEGTTVRSRMGIHTGQPLTSEGDYVGIDVHRAARICEAAHGGQILASDATRIVLEQTPPEAVTLKSMGEHRLKDLLRPEQLFQVVHPDLRESFPPLRTLDAHPHNLPPQPTPLIGREAELDQTRAVLLDEGVRLLTLTGPGGTGKTRLALQLAAQVIDRFRHGAFFVPLAHISDPEMVIPSVAQALGVNETPGRPLLHNLQEYLADKQTLLLLDNLEQLQQAPFVVDRLLAASAELKIIATSRERLRLSWEHEFPVPMLDVPQHWKGDLDALSRNSAVALFVSRCRFVQRDFSLTLENAEAVATICARLEGLPLAIELAAARIKILSPQEIATRLDDQLRLLRGGPRDAPERHQSLQAAISWSYALLVPEEQRLFRRLAVFRGGFALESAEAIGDDDQTDVLDGLSSLVDKSLLRRIGAPGGVTRFLILETIREYGVERLAAEDELSEIRTAHARHFADLADDVEEHLIGPEEEDWMQRLGRDLENLRAAVEWSLQSEGRSAAARLGIGFGWLMYLRGYLTEGRARVSQILDKVGDEPQLRARLMFPAGVLAWSLGDFDTAQGWLEGALRLFIEHGDAKRQAGVSAFLGHVARSRGRIDEANKLHHTALETYRSIGNEKGVAWALYDLGLAARDRGQDDEARALHEQSLALFRKLGYRWGMAWALWNLGVVAHRRGDDAAARDHFRESLELYRVLDDRRGIAQCLEGFAAVSFVAGRPAEATRLLAAADTLRTGLGAPLALSDRREYDRILEGLKAALNSAEFDEEWRIGRTLDLDAAIQITLEVTPSKPPPAARQTGMLREILTPREREVATLVARGLSNRDIAAKLGVAERTAISHVEHIMNKLGLHSRAQIAAWAVRQGLDVPAD
jgi:predicted ATPase/class 3 adenylate cyclase/DNA-binding CsgD family transcriptional regulator